MDEKLSKIKKIMDYHTEIHEDMSEEWFTDLFDRLFEKNEMELNTIIKFIKKRNGKV